MKSFKSFVFVFLAVILIVLGSLASFNYYIDPLWTFNHKNKLNKIQTVIDERQQKMNLLYFGNFDFDTLLIGSSRTTYISQDDFSTRDVFNFSASDLSIKEYRSILNFVTDQLTYPLKEVIIGVDFFKSNQSQSSEDADLSSYINSLNEPFYRYKNLISLEVLAYSRKNFRLSKGNEIIQLRNYNRDNIAFAKAFSDDVKIQETKEKVIKFRNEFYGSNYLYNPEYKLVLEQLKREHPEITFTIFTTPVSTPLFTALVEEGNFSDYEQWLRDTIEVVGGVYNFMYPNEVTTNVLNYFDGHHFYPEVGSQIAEVLSKNELPSTENDFGVFVTIDNIDEHLDNIRTLYMSE